MADQHEPHEMTDRPDQANESGEPGEAGRSHGHIINEKTGEPEGQTARDSDQPRDGDSEHFESGRHDVSQ